MDLIIASRGVNNSVLRDYRKGNWNLQETMVLIEAKKMDDERRMKRVGDNTERGKPAELRWKWVEDYCWKNGCLRSQNQCNDKWDNLMRDFKKVREYERRVVERGIGENKSYWRIEKNERKDNNLPSNLLPQIYEALVEVVERKDQRVTVVADAVGSGDAGGSSNAANVATSSGAGEKSGSILPKLPPPMQQYPIIPAPTMMPPPLPSTTLPSSLHQPLPTVDSDTSEYSDSPAKKRKRRGGGGGGLGGGEGTSGGASEATLLEVGSAISKSASMIAEAIQSSEEREERRHGQVLSIHERRLQIEESKAEISRQGINGLVEAINKLANSILALAAKQNQESSSK